MRFDIDRLSQLAGIKGDSRQLREASNRSYHDGVANDTADERFGKNQLSELGNGSQQGREPLAAYQEGEHEEDLREKRGGKKREKSKTDPGDEDYTWRKDERWGGKKREKSKTDPGDEDFTWREEDDPDGEDGDEGVVLEIDERMLRREIIKMKRERLEENRLRGAIRHEIQDIFASLTNDNSWVYGDNKPRNSRKGSVNMGFAGIGFKR
jgi:hypothetical protein